VTALAGAAGHSADPSGGLAAAHTGGWLTAAGRRIAAGNEPGNLDGLFTRHVLDRTHVTGLDWDVSPLSTQWLDDNHERLAHAPVLAALGYGLALPAAAGQGQGQATARAALADGLPRLMARDPFRGRLTFISSSRQVLGIALAAQVMADQLPVFGDWLADILQDTRLQPAGRFQELLYQHVRTMLGSEVAPVECRPADDAAVLALAHWMAARGTARLPGSADEQRALQQRIVSEALHTDPVQLTIPEVAVLYRAVTAVLDASIDQMVLSRSHLGAALRRFEAAMRRWRSDGDDLTSPIRWPITSEREIQDILWLILRSMFDDVVDEETLPKVGHSTYRADFGLPRLGVLIEVKYARSRGDFKKIEKEVMEDSVAYLRGTSTYKEIVVFIYDESASVQEHDITAAALQGLDTVSDIIIVSRPSQVALPDSRSARSLARFGLGRAIGLADDLAVQQEAPGGDQGTGARRQRT
jgi:REase_DpnII-MboI